MNNNNNNGTTSVFTPPTIIVTCPEILRCPLPAPILLLFHRRSERSPKELCIANIDLGRQEVYKLAGSSVEYNNDRRTHSSCPIDCIVVCVRKFPHHHAAACILL